MENAVLQNYYAEMNGREEAHRQQEQAAEGERLWKGARESFVGRAAEAYAVAKIGNGVPLAEAMGAIAAFFYNPNMAVNPRANDPEPNALKFQQKGFLGNLCNNASWMLQNARQHHAKIVQEVDQLEACHDGSEVSMRNLAFALDREEDSRITQIPACEEWFAYVTATYEAVTGDTWTPPAKKGASAEKQTDDALRKRLERMRSAG